VSEQDCHSKVSRRSILKWTGLAALTPLASAGIPADVQVRRGPTATPSASAGTFTPMQKTLVDIGQAVQLFFDYSLTEMLQDLTQVMHRPVRYFANPVVRRDRSWEDLPYFVGCGCTVS
jgi:hypothetical protein